MGVAETTPVRQFADLKQVNHLDSWELKKFIRSFTLAQKVYDGLHVAPTGFEETNDYNDDAQFCDYLGRVISVPMRANNTPYLHLGYAIALWDLKEGNLMLGDELGRPVEQCPLYRRIPDECPDPQYGVRKLEQWREISSLAVEYEIPASRENAQWERQFRYECARLTYDGHRPARVHYGVSFPNFAVYQKTDKSGNRVIETVRDNTDNSGMLNDVYELMYDHPYDPKLIDSAARMLRAMCEDDDSYHNLCRMFAAPYMQQYKHLSFALIGEGGNGKGTLFSAFTGQWQDPAYQYATRINVEQLAGVGRASSTSMEQEPARLVGKRFAFDEDAVALNADQVSRLKKISTGDQISYRTLGQNVRSFNPQATLVIASNLDFVVGMEYSIRRRFALSRMRDGQSAEDLYDLRCMIHQYGTAPFMMLSIKCWLEDYEQYHGERIMAVAVGRGELLNDAEAWMVNEIVEKGWCSNLENPYRTNPRQTHASFQKLGLQSVRRGGRFVAEVADKTLFAPYRNWMMKIRVNDGYAYPAPPTDTDKRMSRDYLNPNMYGFDAVFAPADEHKVSRTWQKVRDMTNPPTVPPSERYGAYAVIPRDGFMILDFDKSKTGGVDGWCQFSDRVGNYGTLSFPATYTVQTPSGGIHAYYRIPKGVTLKDGNHLNGLNVDVKANGRGYVIGAGSHGAMGDYVYTGENHKVATLSDAMISMLTEYGYVENDTRPGHTTVKPAASAMTSNTVETPMGTGFENPFPADWVKPTGRDMRRMFRRESGSRVHVNVPVMGPGNTHAPMLDCSYSIAARSRDLHWSEETTADAIRQLLDRVPAAHDQRDTRRVIEGAFMKCGIMIPGMVRSLLDARLN